MAVRALTRRQEEAALLVAQDDLSNEQIAARCGVTRQSVDRWKTLPRFAARVEQHRETWRREIEARGIADRQNRVAALNERWQAMRQVISERATDLAMDGVAGGSTGLLVHQIKIVGKGDSALRVDEYVVDTGLLAELRAHEQQAAKELGQWTEKQELTGKDGGPLEIADARERLASRIAGLAARAPAPPPADQPDGPGNGGAAV